MPENNYTERQKIKQLQAAKTPSNHTGTQQQHTDNRIEAVSQRKLQQTMSNSPQTKQLMAFQNMANSFAMKSAIPIQKRQSEKSVYTKPLPFNSQIPAQLTKITNGKSSIENTGQQFTYGPSKTVTVGKEMEAYLDPVSPIRGWSANLNKSQDEMMTTMRSAHGITGGDLVKGHLLNDNLGGTALGDNLYPITRGANSSHLKFVENIAKNHVWHGGGLYYKVVVDGTPSITASSSNFLTEVAPWNPKTNTKGSGAFINVESDLGDVRNYESAYNPDDFSEHLSREKNPTKPKHFVGPAKNVSDLSSVEATARENDS